MRGSKCFRKVPFMQSLLSANTLKSKNTQNYIWHPCKSLNNICKQVLWDKPSSKSWRMRKGKQGRHGRLGKTEEFEQIKGWKWDHFYFLTRPTCRDASASKQILNTVIHILINIVFHLQKSEMNCVYTNVSQILGQPAQCFEWFTSRRFLLSSSDTEGQKVSSI